MIDHVEIGASNERENGRDLRASENKVKINAHTQLVNQINESISP